VITLEQRGSNVFITVDPNPEFEIGVPYYPMVFSNPVVFNPSGYNYVLEDGSQIAYS
jgi:hypothetical protein